MHTLRKSLVVAFFLLICLVTFNGPAVKSYFLIPAEKQICSWQLVSETPRPIVSSTAPEATSAIEGASVVIEWKGLSITHSWTAPGAILTPGQDILFEVSTAWQFDPSSSLNSVGGISTDLNLNYMTHVTARRKSINFSVDPSGSVSESYNWTVPSGSKPGAKLTIIAFADSAVAGGRVDYTYQYVCEEPTPEAAPIPTETPESTPTPASTVEPFECEGIGGDSGARFTDFGGEVLIWPCDNRGDERPAEYDEVLREGYHVKTGGASFAIISYADGSTFNMKSRSEVVLGYRPKKVSKLRLVAGNIWVNVQKMVLEGTLDVTMNQAVAGTKGTTFVLEDDGQVSTLKVFDGTLSFTSLSTGKTVDVHAGNSISADATGLAEIVPINTDEEKAAWPEMYKEVDEQILPVQSEPAQPEDRSGQTVSQIIATPLFGAASAGILIIFMIVGSFVVVRNINRPGTALTPARMFRNIALLVLAGIVCIGIMLAALYFIGS